jgi:hypothetical protein
MRLRTAILAAIGDDERLMRSAETNCESIVSQASAFLITSSKPACAPFYGPYSRRAGHRRTSGHAGVEPAIVVVSAP